MHESEEIMWNETKRKACIVKLFLVPLFARCHTPDGLMFPPPSNADKNRSCQLVLLVVVVFHYAGLSSRPAAQFALHPQ